jgi:hypothetical protein
MTTLVVFASITLSIYLVIYLSICHYPLLSISYLIYECAY